MKICLQDRGFHSMVLGRVLSRSGHDVYFTSNHKLSEAYGTSIGYDERFQNVLDRDWDLVIDCTGNFSFEGYVDALRNRGVPCIGGGLFGARAEYKNIGRAIFTEVGCPCPKWQHFPDGDAAVRAIESGEFQSVVIKFISPAKTLRTSVRVSPRDAIFWLRKWRNEPVILEERVNGIEVACTAYFDGHNWFLSVTNFEHKHKHDGGKGVLTGEMGTSMLYDPTPVWLDLYESFLSSPTGSKYLKQYRGIIDVNCILGNDGKLYPLEFTTRFGVPTSNIMSTLFDESMDYGAFLLSVARGNGDPGLLRHKRAFAVGVNLVGSEYPYGYSWPAITRPFRVIYGVESLEQTYSFGPKVTKNADMYVCESGDWVMNIAASGATMSEAQRLVYADVAKISFADMAYRTDIGNTWERDKDTLHQSGLITKRML